MKGRKMETLRDVTHIDNVKLNEEENAVVIIDQTQLPNKTEYLTLGTAEDLYDAIFELKVRGAPAIGICAAYGICVLANKIETDDYDTFYEQFRKDKEYLDSSRPTAVNLSWALNRMERVVTSNQDKPVRRSKHCSWRRAKRSRRRICVCAGRFPSTGCPCSMTGRDSDPLQCRAACHFQIRHRSWPPLPREGERHGVPCICR